MHHQSRKQSHSHLLKEPLQIRLCEYLLESMSSVGSVCCRLNGTVTPGSPAAWHTTPRPPYTGQKGTHWPAGTWREDSGEIQGGKEHLDSIKFILHLFQNQVKLSSIENHVIGSEGYNLGEAARALADLNANVEGIFHHFLLVPEVHLEAASPGV